MHHGHQQGQREVQRRQHHQLLLRQLTTQVQCRPPQPLSPTHTRTTRSEHQASAAPTVPTKAAHREQSLQRQQCLPRQLTESRAEPPASTVPTKAAHREQSRASGVNSAYQGSSPRAEPPALLSCSGAASVLVRLVGSGVAVELLRFERTSCFGDSGW